MRRLRDEARPRRGRHVRLAMPRSGDRAEPGHLRGGGRRRAPRVRGVALVALVGSAHAPASGSAGRVGRVGRKKGRAGGPKPAGCVVVGHRGHGRSRVAAPGLVPATAGQRPHVVGRAVVGSGSRRRSGRPCPVARPPDRAARAGSGAGAPAHRVARADGGRPRGPAWLTAQRAVASPAAPSPPASSAADPSPADSRQSRRRFTSRPPPYPPRRPPAATTRWQG